MLKTKAPEISDETLNKISLAATQRYEEIIKSSVGAVKACRSGLKNMYEQYYLTNHGQLDECENRIISTIQAFLRTMNVPKENYVNIIDEVIKKFYEFYELVTGNTLPTIDQGTWIKILADLSKEISECGDENKTIKLHYLQREWAICTCLQNFFDTSGDNINEQFRLLKEAK